MGRQKTQNFHLNDEGEKQSWRTDKTQLQNLFVSIIICYSNQDTVILAKKSHQTNKKPETD